MPTRKQRRRRAKEQRHEYEYVLVDEEGQEVEIDPAELRAQREERTKAKGQERGKAAPAKDRRGRPIKEVRPPSWQRALKRSGAFVGVLFLFLVIVPAKNKSPIYVSLALAIGYGAVAAPFFFWMDRLAYRRYLRATGRDDEIPPKRQR